MGAATLETYQAIHAPLECEVAAISPDGKLLAAIVRAKGDVEVRVIDLETAVVKAGARVDPELAKFASFDRIIWTSDTRVVAQVGWREIVAMDADGKNHRRVVDWQEQKWYDGPITSAVRAFPRNVRLVAWSADEPEFVHVESAWLGRVKVVRVQHLTGKAEVTWEGTGDEPFIYDQKGVPRIRPVSRTQPEGFELRAIGGKQTGWMTLDRFLGSELQPEFRLTVTNVHGPRSVPLGFGRDPEVLYIASNIGRDTFGIYALDLRSKRRTEFTLEHQTLDLAPAFLPTTGGTVFVRERKSGDLVGVRFASRQAGAVWVDPELRDVQERIERMVPDYGVRIENWDDARENFLVRLSHRADPGGFGVYSRASRKLRHFLGRAPRLDALPPLHSTAWVIKRPDGTVFTGHLTLPPRSGGSPRPVAVLLRSSIWGTVPADYSPVTHALGHMGYAVLEVGHRGTLGQGLRHWEAGRGRLDEVTAEDVFVALERIATEAKLDPGRVALVGFGFGANLALKVAILRPERVACVIAEGPLVDIYERVRDGDSTYASSVRMRKVDRSFFGPTDERLKTWSPIVLAPQITRPVMVVTVKENYTSSLFDPTAGFIKKLKATKTPPFVLEETAVKGRPEMNARVSAATEKFLAEHLPVAPR